MFLSSAALNPKGFVDRLLGVHELGWGVNFVTNRNQKLSFYIQVIWIYQKNTVYTHHYFEIMEVINMLTTFQ